MSGGEEDEGRKTINNKSSCYVLKKNPTVNPANRPKKSKNHPKPNPPSTGDRDTLKLPAKSMWNEVVVAVGSFIHGDWNYS